MEAELLNNLLYGLIAGLATTLGGIIVLFIHTPKKEQMSLYLGFAAGVMIGVSVFELIPHGLEISNIWYCIAGFILGCLVIWGLDLLLTKKNWSVTLHKYGKIGYFMAMGIALHNLPEGLAIGAGYGAAPTLGLVIAVSIGLHNIPEGMSIALPLRISGCSWKKILGVTTLAGLVTPIGSIIGYLISSISNEVITAALGMAAGCMLYIASDELIPESHHCHSHMANLGILSGFIVMLVLSSI
jgi:ZIP family zinc transporter